MGGVNVAAPATLKVTYWDPRTLRIIAHGNHIFTNLTSASAPGGADTVRYTGKVAPAGIVTAGTLATLHPRLGISNGTGRPAGLTYLITNSTRVHTANVTLHGGATEAVVEAGGNGGHTYNGVRVVRRQGQSPVRLLAANADGFHSSCVRDGPSLVDSEISFTGDDLLNIHSRLAIVLRPLSSTSAYVVLASSVPIIIRCPPLFPRCRGWLRVRSLPLLSESITNGLSSLHAQTKERHT